MSKEQKLLLMTLVLILALTVGYKVENIFTSQSKLHSVVSEIDKIVKREKKENNVKGLSIGLITAENKE